MKTTSLAACLACTLCPAFAAIPVGRGELSFAVGATATHDTNINGTNAAESDYYGTFTPLVRYQRKAGLIEAEASLGITFLRFAEQTRFNSENTALDLLFRLREDPSQKLTGSVRAGYHETSEVNSDLNARVRARTLTFGGLGNLLTGPRTRLGFELNYADIARSSGSDQQLFHGQARFDYEGFLDDTVLRLAYDHDRAQTSGENIRGVELDQTAHQFLLSIGRAVYRDVIGRIGAGYRWLTRSAAETPTGETQLAGTVFMASLEGPFLPPKYFPKIKSRLAVSYEDAAAPGVNDVGTKNLAGSLSLIWQARDTTVVSLQSERRQRLAANDLTILSTNVRLRLEQTLRYNLTGFLSAGYAWETFRGIERSDRRKSGDAGLDYRFARTWNATASYRFESVSSSEILSTYDRQILTLGLGYQF